jgi:hypothetical protein
LLAFGGSIFLSLDLLVAKNLRKKIKGKKISKNFVSGVQGMRESRLDGLVCLFFVRPPRGPEPKRKKLFS